MPGKRKRGTEATKLEGELSSLSPSQIREELKAVGQDVGPVDSSNKDIYIRMLARKKLKLETETVTSTSLTTSPTRLTSPRDSPRAGLAGASRRDGGLTGARVTSPRYGPRAGLAAGARVTSPSSSPRAGLTRKPLTKSSSTPTSNIIPGIGVSPDPPVSASKKKVTGPKATGAKATGLKATTKSRQSDLQAIRDFTVQGLTAATFTPFIEEGELNLSVIGKYVDWLLDCGVNNVFLNGTTGESLSLTVGERKLLVEEWIRVAAGRLTVIVHVGTENLKNTCELAKHAQEVGAKAIGIMPTTFFKPASIDHLTLYLQKVADCAPSLPMYYYHIPTMTGVNFSMEEFLEVAGPRLPTLRGLKYTSKDLMEFGRCVSTQAEKYQIIYGADEQVIGALSLGGIAAIGSTYNYAGKLYNRLFSAYKRKDTEAAKLEQRRSQAMIKLLFKYGSHAGGGKAFLKLSGVDCGPPRLPVLPLTPENVRSLETDLCDIGYFEWS